MKKKEIGQSIKVIILGLVLALGISYAFAQPVSAYEPLNVGPKDQNKAGGLNIAQNGVGGLDVGGWSPDNIGGTLTTIDLAVWARSLFKGDSGFYGNAYFFGDTVVQGLKDTSKNTPQPVCADPATGKLEPCTP